MSTRPPARPSGPDPDLDTVMSERRQLVNLTYRLLGSLAEAEDAVQETWASGSPSRCPPARRAAPPTRPTG